MRKNQRGFTLIEILVVLAVLVITAAGGKVVWEKKVLPTPIATPQILPTPTVFPILTQSCTTDNDCPKQFCQPSDKPCAQYYCISGKCQLVQPETEKISCQTDADCPRTACAQGCPVEGPCPPCPQNKCINGKCQIIYPLYYESLNKKIRLVPSQTVTIKDVNFSLALLSITTPTEDCFDCPTTAEVEVRSGNNSEKITFVAGVLATEKVERELSSKEIFGFKITREELRSEWIILRVQKL